MNLFTRFALSLLALLPLAAAQAQGVVLLDDFNRVNSSTVGGGWTETEPSGTATVGITSNQLRLSSGTSGHDFVVRDVSTRYNPVLSSNGAPLSWAWNTQESRTAPSGFGGNNYGSAFVLAASAVDLAGTATNGYAVVQGNTGTPHPVRLVRFTGGLTSNSNLTTICSASTEDGAKALTLRVTYSPQTNTWKLEASSNTATFQDPAVTTTYVTLGTGTDATYTSSALPFLGCLWNHATTATESAVFDNVCVPAPACPLASEPTASPSAGTADQLTTSGARLSFAAGTGTVRLVVLRAGQAPTGTPADAATYTASAVFGSGSTLAAGDYVVYNGPSTSLSISGLQPATSYYYAAYEAAGTGCGTNYRQVQPLTGSFTTPATTPPPCTLVARPTTTARQGSATAATGSLTVSWLNGNGIGRLVALRPAQAVAALPTDGTAYAANAAYGSGAALSSDTYVVYAGSGSSVTVTGLTAGQTYYAAVYEDNGSGCTTAYLTTTPAVASATVPTTTSPPPSTAYNFYRGNLHAHSGYSDGNKDAATSGASTPAADFALAHQAQQFDFMGISEHNHSQAGMQLASFAKGLQEANQANQDGKFVALYGMEYGTISGGGHVIIYGYDQLLGWEAGNYDVYVPQGNYTALFATVAQKSGAIAYLAHPQQTDYNNLFSTALNATTAKVLVGTAMRSGPAFSTATDYSNPSTSTYEARYQDALRLGYHVGPTMDHDTHYSVFGRSSYARLVLLAPTLTRASLLDALQQRRFYAADDDNAQVTFQVGSHPMGSVLTQRGAPTLKVTVADPDANDAVASIALYAGIPGGSSAAALLTTSTGSATLTYTDPILNNAMYYYYAVITQTDGDKIWTAPIRYTRNDAAAALARTAPAVPSLSFQGVLQGEGQAVLRWTAKGEVPGVIYVLERSADGQNFLEMGRVAAAAGPESEPSYELRDAQPLTQLTTYRIRVEGPSGAGTNSAVARVSPAAREVGQFSVYPNPAAGTVTPHLALRGFAGRAVQVQVRDMLGRVISTQQLAPAAYLDIATLVLPPALPAGLYTISLTDGSRTITTRWTLEP